MRGIPSKTTFWLAAALLAAGMAAAQTAAVRDDAEPRQAASLLTLRCLSCHNSVRHSGGIDLSTRSRAASAGLFTAAQPGGSRLERAVRAGKMPPDGPLTSVEKGLLSRWVTAGALYPVGVLQAAAPARAPLWSFHPVQDPQVPHSRFDFLSKNPVDRFLFAKLEMSGLRPSPLADRRTLLRRVSVDLTGLPPTPEEMQAFLADARPDAYERVVDRLLASPAYGERWGRFWLDVVRFGESNGYEQNHLRPNAWPYRDYVIAAYNEDIPYPQFIQEQIAGDALTQSRPAAEAATGFLVAGTHDTVGIQTEEGTRQQRSNDLDDIVSTTGAAFLGLTVGCAKCHDHKFDPIPQRDFYRLAACFAGVQHGQRPLRPATEAERQELARAAARLNELQNSLNDLDNRARTRALQAAGSSAVSRPAVNARRNEDTFAPVTARSLQFTVLATNDGAEPCLDELQVFGPDAAANVALASAGSRASASSLLPGYAAHSVPHLNDGRLGNDYSWISSTRGEGWARIDFAREQRISRVVWSRDGGEIPRFDDRLPTRYRIEVSPDGKSWTTVSTDAGRAGSQNYIHPDELLRVMTPDERAQRSRLTGEIRDQSAVIAASQSRGEAYIGRFTAPEPTFLLRRGDVMQRIEEVKPGALSEIVSLQSDLLPASSALEPERRLALARWIADPRNPLTARVYVNRVWQNHFGRGIVGTPSDFGRNGEPPSHPELLDWLASRFMQPASAGSETFAMSWRLKPLHRLLVTSYAYRQSSATSHISAARDAGNLLLWRMSLRRLEAEAVRDSILAVSGRLDRRMGGSGFRLYKYNVVNVAIYEPLDSFGPETWRRSVYQQAARGIRDDLLGAFDCPESSQRAPRRESTTTALQALSLLNGAFVSQQADFFAGRVRAEAGSTTALQVRRAFQLAFGRPPNAAESSAAVALAQRDGLTSVCRALLNANEFLYY